MAETDEDELLGGWGEETDPIRDLLGAEDPPPIPEPPPRPAVELTEEQRRVEAAVFEFATAGPEGRVGRRPFLTVGGYAGVGKSVVVAAARARLEEAGKRVHCCAYTGKAAAVLRGKGIPFASTLHSYLYQPRSDREDRSKIRFVLKDFLPDDVVVVDEASMVDRERHRDLGSFGLPVVYVGDHGQLPPVGEQDGFNLMADPDLRLETIHRQAAGSNILRLAEHVRRGGELRYCELPSLQVLPDHNFVGRAADALAAGTADAAIVGFNRTRRKVNEAARRAAGRRGELPQPGERVICLRNFADLGVFNGLVATALAAEPSADDPDCYWLSYDDGAGGFGRVKALRAQLGQERTLPHDRAHKRREITLWDFGYALTLWKSQGSEFDRAMVCEEVHPDTDLARWRYTAVTRAAKELVYCC